ncbi:lysophospholipid acyltransferase family protein [Aequorivita echinoideorum]|uniref:Lysophospholipid acyltransferase family protein n=1 Tax=Aequorivita echinoideorum TaxID=1549647 RepID=A0ABS5S7H4_9FLAO|nr:lysophospholipid acyltransferase family protein [Aequorivita echinoideorum]MBT0609158.1 lysophospholipid acyltransferase family protein [Aequorivita echinoideorum]
MQRLLYILVYPMLWLISLLPLRILQIKSTLLFYLVYYVIGYRKNVVNENLALVFPNMPKADRKRIAEKFYRHLCDIIFETIKSISISEAEIKSRFHFENLHILEEYYQKDRNILLMCGHYASWEWSGILNKMMPYKGFAVYKKLDNRYFDKLVKKIRGRFGATIVSNRKIVPLLFRRSKKGEKSLTLILSDQTPKMGAFKHRDTFMGIDVPVFTGTEELAKKLDFSAMYLHVEKIKRGYYTARFIPLAEKPKDFPDFEITRKFLNEIEKQIHHQPEFYLWSHKRWKLRNQN